MHVKQTECNATFVPISETGYFSPLVKDYLDGAAALRPFYNFTPDDKGLLAAIEERKKFSVDRNTLVEILKKQYEGLELSEAASANLELLFQETTFTVCSAHQPNLMTGYLYFFYKIIHSVKLAQHGKSLNPSLNFVPVFYIGSEDNDFEELGHFNYANQKFEWETTQTGAVGMMKVDENLTALISKLLPLLGPLGIEEIRLKATIKSAFSKGNTIAVATRILINDLVGDLGVLVLDANEAALKCQFKAIIKKEIFEPKAFEIVNATSEKLQEKYKAQAFYRPINLFYLKKGLRERIEYQEDKFVVVNNDLQFTPEEMELEIEQFPKRFSPNVILRGVYQESILPNIAFIGGGSEVAYWMQLKDVFSHYGVFFPMVVLRQSALIMNEKTRQQQEKLGLDDTQIFKKQFSLEQDFVQEEKKGNWELADYHAQLQKWNLELKTKFEPLNQNLDKSIEAAITKMNHQVDIIDKKVDRAIKRKLEVKMEQLNQFKIHAFPKDSLQERHDTFLPYFLQYGDQLFQDLLNFSTPFGNEFLILHYAETGTSKNDKNQYHIL